ncbi:hypothetical protein AAHE18_18G111300 [Arachis hypogaea]
MVKLDTIRVVPRLPKKSSILKTKLHKKSTLQKEHKSTIQNEPDSHLLCSRLNSTMNPAQSFLKHSTDWAFQTVSVILACISLYWAYPLSVYGIFFNMCHMHHQWRVFGRTFLIAPNMDLHWSVMMACERVSTYFSHCVKTHSKLRILSFLSKAHPSKVDFP